jgi:RNA polymerase sigma-54 factor
MKQSLSIKLGQQLKMTPQLQQAIRLLQLSALELEQEIQSSIDSNPMLESEDDFGEASDTDSGELSDSALKQEQPTDYDDSVDFLPSDQDSYGDNNQDRTEDQALAPDQAEEMISVDDNDVSIDGVGESEVSDQLHEPLADDIPVDSNWDDIYPQSPGSGTAETDFDPNANRGIEETLESHLLWQLNLTPMAASDRVIAAAIIDAIDEDGMLGTTVDDICETLANNVDPSDVPPSVDEVLEILRRIQQFDPIGVAARDIRECLLLQLDGLSVETPWLDQARSLVDLHLDLLGSKDFTALVRQTGLTEHELSQVVALIRTLQPRPGAALLAEQSDYEIPDVLVRKENNRWLVELNPETLPKVRLNTTYANLIKEVGAGPDKDYLKDNLQEAKWFLKSLQTRHDTLLKVATKIVEVQRDFLEYGAEAMKPLILADIAEQVDLHESTISRVTNRKYLATPQGLYELKYFFSSHVGTASGGEVSSTAIRAIIRKVTAEENPRKPLSDNKIAAILAEQNITVARRTVAKYRESMSIPPSNERKQLV